MVVDGTGESPSRLTSAPIYHAAFDDVEYISAVRHVEVADSPLEEDGFEPPVPLGSNTYVSAALMYSTSSNAA